MCKHRCSNNAKEIWTQYTWCVLTRLLKLRLSKCKVNHTQWCKNCWKATHALCVTEMHKNSLTKGDEVVRATASACALMAMPWSLQRSMIAIKAGRVRRGTHAAMETLTRPLPFKMPTLFTMLAPSHDLNSHIVPSFLIHTYSLFKDKPTPCQAMHPHEAALT